MTKGLVRKMEILENAVREEELVGLTAAEARAEAERGNANVAVEKVGKSYARIIFDNLFTFFNMVWALVAVVLIAIGSYENLTFLFIIIPNALIAIVQEIRAKKTVEKLSVTTEPRATVLRDGSLIEIPAEEVVLGDVMKIELGKQVLADAEVISGLAEANESMLTGESDAIKKQAGDTVLAGSYLVSGSIYARVQRVGAQNYVHSIEKAAKGFKKPVSNLFRDLNRLIKYIGIFLVPMAVVTFIANYFAYSEETINVVIEKTCGSIIGMIPAGIYLLVTVTLTLSVISLAKKKTLVKDMYSIEMLASADVVCLDKTGTITDGTMCVTDVIALGGVNDEYIREVMPLIEGAEESLNNTSRALIEHFGKAEAKVLDRIPFSSARKYSAVTVEGYGSFSIGAPGFVPCPVGYEMEKQIAAFAREGKRVLLLAMHDAISEQGRAIAMIAITDRIRPNAKEIIEKFQRQGVTIKIISGDHAATVSTIAKRVGVIGADRYVSCDRLTDEQLVKYADRYTVFGRVTPEQKVLLVKTLKAAGHTVAMTGDGVNDTLALKESNCAIAMADGSEVARAVSQIVLMDSDFATLPDVVREGRRCINNVRQSASLFLMKTVFTICLTIYTAATLTGYPFEPKQFMLLEMFVIGISSVLLALEPNNKRIEGTFLKKVLIHSAPNAFVMFIPVLIALLLGTSRFGISVESRNAIATIVVTIVGLINLIALCRPFTKWRIGVCAIVTVGIAATVGINLLIGDILGLAPAVDNLLFFFGMIGLGISLAVLLQLFSGAMERGVYAIVDKIEAKLAARRAAKAGRIALAKAEAAAAEAVSAEPEAEATEDK